MNPANSALLTDLYQLTMLQGYHDAGMAKTAVFEFFVRRLRPGRGFLLAAGLEQSLDYLEQLHFSLLTNWNGWRRPSASAAISSPRWKTCASAATSMPCPKARCSFPTSRSCA